MLLPVRASDFFQSMLKLCLDFSYIYLYELKTAPPRSMPPEGWVALPRQASLDAADG
ncbi:hypothetical protein [Comamonas sp.]|uniref:hypothetical protein n=1 Tax=Comamonas sp. TaxID=34028 RepID=UPI002649F62B|nr:hypothetical protein [Comamonas sp.]